MRRDGATLREIQEWINVHLRAQGIPERRDQGQEGKAYFRAARRWADSGWASLEAFRAIDNEWEALIAAARRAQEAMWLLDRIADGSFPLVGVYGVYIQARRIGITSAPATKLSR